MLDAVLENPSTYCYLPDGNSDPDGTAELKNELAEEYTADGGAEENPNPELLKEFDPIAEDTTAEEGAA